MRRDSYDTVTSKESFALLVDAIPPELPMGEATFDPEIGPPRPVRPVTLDDLKATVWKMRSVEGKAFSALLALKGALEARDQTALTSVREKLEAVYQQQRKERAAVLPEDKESRRKLGQQWGVIGLDPEDALQHIEGLRPGPRAEKELTLQLSWAVSKTIVMWSKLVLWWVNDGFSPAIHCSGLDYDHAMRIALYVHTFLIAPNREVGFRVCPYDGELFFQERPNQEYCRPEHREAHRVTRWRNKWKNQQRSKRKGGNDGTQKTG